MKIFCDKGAERKLRDEERRAAKRRMTPSGKRRLDEMYHETFDRYLALPRNIETQSLLKRNWINFKNFSPTVFGNFFLWVPLFKLQVLPFFLFVGLPHWEEDGGAGESTIILISPRLAGLYTPLMMDKILHSLQARNTQCPAKPQSMVNDLFSGPSSTP